MLIDMKFPFPGKLISENLTKHTSISKVEYEGECFVVKRCSPDSPSNIKSSFSRESAIYELEPECTPNLYDSDKYRLVIEYIDGERVGDILFRGDFTCAAMALLFESAVKFYQSLERTEAEQSFDNYYRYLRVLMRSGPLQTKGIHQKNNFFSKKLRPRVYGLLALLVAIIVKIEIKSGVDYLGGFSHSDFHYNNVIHSHKSFYFFDFERSELSGYFAFDLIFLLVLVDCLKSHNNINDSLNLVSMKILDSVGKRLVFKLFKAAVSNNPRFFVKNEGN